MVKSHRKQWRKLDDSEAVEHIKKRSHQERHGPAVESLKDEQLFFVDKSADHASPAAAGQRAKKAGKKEMRPTRAQLILTAPQQVKPVIEQKRAPPKKRSGEQQGTQANKRGRQEVVEKAVQIRHPAKVSADEELDLWSSGLQMEEAAQPSTSAPANQQQDHQSFRGPSVKRKGSRAGRMVPPIKAVEIDMAGCSYNPEEESHQDALATLVAAENNKLLKKELGPLPVSLVDVAELQAQNELAQLQTYADEDDNEIELGNEGEATDVRGRQRAAAQKTTKDRNREARRIQQEQELETKRALKRQRQQLEHLASLKQQLEQEEEEGKQRLLRKQVMKAEKAASQPPRLSKQRFEDMSVQVLTTDEAGEGLRRLRGCPMLALERFKSIQKRGLIETRKRRGPQGQKKMVEYEKQARRERAVEGQAELLAMQKTNKITRKSNRG